MHMIRRSILGLLLVTFGGCATMRTWELPLSPMEGQRYVPALISVGQTEGLRAFRGVSGAVVELEDGTRLSWQDSANRRDFILLVDLPSETPEADYENRFLAAKARADDLWNKATSARRALAPVAVLQVPASSPSDCLMGSDGSRACGYHCMLGSNGRADCAATPDGSCHLNSNGTVSCGRSCQFTSSGRWQCF